MRNWLRNLWEGLDTPRCVYIVTGGSVLLRLGALLVAARVPLDSDARGYHTMALQLLHRENFSPFWPPGLPCFLAFFAGIFGEGEVAARVAVLLLYPVFCGFLFALLSECAGRRAANLGVLFFALYPEWIRYSIWPMTELPAATLLVALAYYLWMACRKPSRVLPLILGLLLAALTLTRSGSVLLVAFVPVYFWFKTKRHVATILMLLAFMLPVAAWLVKAHEMTGRWALLNDAAEEDLFLGNNPYTPLYRTWPGGQAEIGMPPELLRLYHATRNQPPAVRNPLFRQMALEHIRSRPDLFLLRTLSRIRTYFAFSIHRGERFKNVASSSEGFEAFLFLTTCADAVFYWALMLMAIFGIFYSEDFSFQRSAFTIILGVLSAYSIPYWVVFSNPRLHLPILPLLAAPAAAFVQVLAENSRRQVFQTFASPAGRKWGLIGALALFGYIQIEWGFVTYLKL